MANNKDNIPRRVGRPSNEDLGLEVKKSVNYKLSQVDRDLINGVVRLDDSLESNTQFIEMLLNNYRADNPHILVELKKKGLISSDLS